MPCGPTWVLSRMVTPAGVSRSPSRCLTANHSSLRIHLLASPEPIACRPAAHQPQTQQVPCPILALRLVGQPESVTALGNRLQRTRFAAPGPVVIYAGHKAIHGNFPSLTNWLRRCDLLTDARWVWKRDVRRAVHSRPERRAGRAKKNG